MRLLGHLTVAGMLAVLTWAILTMLAEQRRERRRKAGTLFTRLRERGTLIRPR